MWKTLSIFFALCLTACAFDPVYEGSHCGPGLSCPEGYTCDDSTKTCKRSSQEPVPNDAQDAGLDAGQADDSPGTDDQADAGGDNNDGGDFSSEDSDSTDGQNDAGQQDAGDESPADEGPCGGCSSNQWCDVEDNTCKPCNDPDHCGATCEPCQEGQTCSNVGAGGFCCLGTCDLSTACAREQCGSYTWICKASFNPLAYSWVDLATVNALFCALSDQDGIVQDAYQCDPNDERYLLFFCPWGGTCQDNSQCEADADYGNRHLCGESFGCDTDHCRMHYKDGMTCQYNFDCESFCCQRGDSPTCTTPDGTRSQCRISTTFYKEGVTKYSWHTLPQDSNTDPHTISAWWWAHDSDHPAQECANDSDCDTGDCSNFTGVGKRCKFPSCMPNTEADTIKAHYFCDSAEQDHDAHINVVTNLDPLPSEAPPNCVYLQ